MLASFDARDPLIAETATGQLGCVILRSAAMRATDESAPTNEFYANLLRSETVKG